MDTRVKPVRGVNLTASEEASQLEKNLQRQLEEDVARIFDESIYTDLEVACGKSKLLTHSCILKTRTNRFYRKLETFLHVNIGRNIFDEIYSFISDAYTECNINHQEKEILQYLNDNVIVNHKNCTKSQITYKNGTYSTPRSLSPEKDLYLNNLSPSTELTKEYYALVPIDGHLLEQEPQPPFNKPTTLSFVSSRTLDIVKHSTNCPFNLDTSHYETVKGQPIRYSDKTAESVYTPDSLITDDPSSSSDYLSATYSWPQGRSSSICLPPFNINNKMDNNIINLSDSGMENSMLESQSSYFDVTLTDLSLTESTAQDLTVDDLNKTLTNEKKPLECHMHENTSGQSDKASCSTSTDSSNGQIGYQSQSIKVQDGMATKSSKEEKLQQSEKIMVLDSSSLSSETGSWETTFPPKLSDREICENFINIERQDFNEPEASENLWPSLNQETVFKSKPCFINAANLVDEEDMPQNVATAATDVNYSPKRSNNKDVTSMEGNLQDPVHSQEFTAAAATNVSRNENCDDQNPPKTTSAWVIDMSTPLNTDDKNMPASKESLPSEAILNSNYKPRQNYFIDLSSLPDPLPQEHHSESLNASEKKMFSLYIDLGKTSSLKEMPARFSSSTSSKKQQATTETKVSKEETIWNGTLISKTEDNEGLATFEKYEALCDDPNISISGIINLPKYASTTKCKKTDPIKEIEHAIPEVEEPPDTKYTTVIESVNNKPAKPFVKLSDLDKPPVKTDVSSQNLRKEHDLSGVRMTRSIPENNWSANKPSTSHSAEIMTSFHSENAESLNRLFPHLKSEFSKSMPLSMQGSLNTGHSSNQTEHDDQALDLTERSCTTNCLCRSLQAKKSCEETHQITYLIANCQSRLGQDLLRMFVEEIAPDVIVEVSGKRIKAHKCILSSRCQYFAMILSGGWVESAGNVIVLPPFSPNVAHFALCHIYSGVSVIPESICIVELATVADMLYLDGLKDVVMFTLQSKYCHHFHKPCQVCITGVHECLIMTWVYGLDDLFHKCLKWITTNFTKIWPTKAFATLPPELLEKCYKDHVNNFSIDTFLDWVYGFGITLSLLPTSRWAENVELFGKQLLNAAASFASIRLIEIFKKILFTTAEVPWPARHALEDCITNAIDWASCEEICKAYTLLYDHVKELRQNDSIEPDVNEETLLLTTHANNWRLQCEEALVRSPDIAGTQTFKDLPDELKKRLRELGCISIYEQTAHRQALSQKRNKQNKSRSSNSRNSDIDEVRAVFVPYASAPSTKKKTLIRSTNEIIEPKKHGVNPPVVRTTKAQEKRAMYNMTKRNQLQEQINSKSVKPVRPLYHKKETGHPVPKASANKESNRSRKKLVNRVISSSESSRNTSPAQVVNNRASRSKAKQVRAHAMSQDSLSTASRPRTTEHSTDSPSESQASTSNNYATYTKYIHRKKGALGYSEKDRAKQNATKNMKEYKTFIPIPQELKCVAKKQSAAGGGTSKSLVATTQGERKSPGSLMNATKASQAKILPKIVKESKGAIPKSTKHAGRQPEQRAPAHPPPPPPPALQRSGTFLKDEPSCSGTNKTDNPNE